MKSGDRRGDFSPSGKLLHSISGGRGIVTFPLSVSTIKFSAPLPNVSTVPFSVGKDMTHTEC